MHDITPRLLAVAHGTASAPGRSTIEALITALAAARPSIRVDLCYLDVLRPRLPEALDDSPTVVVPLLLSTGYHVQTDIPAAVALATRTTVACHLGPHPLLVDALVDRLTHGHPDVDAATVLLVGAGSSRPEATAELTRTAELLEERLAVPVVVRTMSDDLDGALRHLPGPVRISTYLLAEGYFADTVRSSAEKADAALAEPLGPHPAVVELIWTRYDEALVEVR